jgi:hypothetical protein
MDAGLLDAVMASIWAALGAVGHKVLTDVEDQAADESVKLGRRLLARLLRRGGSTDPARPQLEAAVCVAAEDPADEDYRSALRGQVKMALTGKDGVDDPTLAADLARLLEAAGVQVSASGARSVVVGHNEGIISTGDQASNTIHRGGA